MTRILEYKVLETGSQLVKVDPSFTTQTCSRCGQIKEGEERLSLTERTFFCSCCGLIIDRDLNAARNIFSRAGLARSYACGDDVRLPIEEVSSMKQELDTPPEAELEDHYFNRGRMSRPFCNAEIRPADADALSENIRRCESSKDPT